jgi:hypothetical protein
MSDVQKKAPIPAAASPGIAHMLKNFAIGGVSGMIATCFVQPVDMIKVRI